MTEGKIWKRREGRYRNWEQHQSRRTACPSVFSCPTNQKPFKPFAASKNRVLSKLPIDDRSAISAMGAAVNAAHRSTYLHLATCGGFFVREWGVQGIANGRGRMMSGRIRKRLSQKTENKARQATSRGLTKCSPEPSMARHFPAIAVMLTFAIRAHIGCIGWRIPSDYAALIRSAWNVAIIR